MIALRSKQKCLNLHTHKKGGFVLVNPNLNVGETQRLESIYITFMILSMTGFGKGLSCSRCRKITIEIKSLNSKQLDLSMRLPSHFRELEAGLRNDISRELERGKVDFIAGVESLVDEGSTTVNFDVLKGYKAQIEKLGAELGIPAPADWYSVLLRMPDAYRTSVQALAEDDKEAFMTATHEAVASLVDFRITEGAKLYDFFKKKIENISRLLEEVEKYEEERVPRIKSRLEEQLSKLTSIEYEKGRLEQELIFYIEKLDVNEEKLRLRSHLNYFLETMGPRDAGEASGKGKKLGFISQEMGREINTLGSKSNHAEMQKIVVMMKDELEQIKEQVLNVL